MLDAPNEGWDQIHVLEEGDIRDTRVEIEVR